MTTEANGAFPVIRGRAIAVDENGLVCLNDVWRAAGFKKNKRPHDWTRLPSVSEIMEEVLKRITGKSRNWAKSDFRSVFYTKRGAGGGTFADVRLALMLACFQAIGADHIRL